MVLDILDELFRVFTLDFPIEYIVVRFLGLKLFQQGYVVLCDPILDFLLSVPLGRGH